MVFQKQNNCELLMLTILCQNMRKTCRKFQYWLINMQRVWLGIWLFMAYWYMNFFILCNFLSCISTSPSRICLIAQLNSVGFLIKWCKCRYEFRAPRLAFRLLKLCLAQSAFVSSLSSPGLLWNSTCSFICFSATCVLLNSALRILHNFFGLKLYLA